MRSGRGHRRRSTRGGGRLLRHRGRSTHELPLAAHRALVGEARRDDGRHVRTGNRGARHLGGEGDQPVPASSVSPTRPDDGPRQFGGPQRLIGGALGSDVRPSTPHSADESAGWSTPIAETCTKRSMPSAPRRLHRLDRALEIHGPLRRAHVAVRARRRRRRRCRRIPRTRRGSRRPRPSRCRAV